MRPEDFDTHLDLKEQVSEAQNKFSQFTERRFSEVTPGVEGLSPAQRFQRLSALIEHETQDIRQERSMFGARTHRGGRTPSRLVVTPAGKEYLVSLSSHIYKQGFRSMPLTDISASWRNLPGEDHFEHREDVDDTWIHDNPTHKQGLRNLTDLEWTMEAYLLGRPVA